MDAASSSRNLKRTPVRVASDAERQLAAASVALATAASISAALAKSTSPVCSPVAGLKTAPERPEPPWVAAPLVQWGMRVVMRGKYRPTTIWSNAFIAMLQNMWQELVEAVDDHSAKGIALALSAGIDRGVLRPGERLPPIRRVARDLQVAPATISAAWSQLARAGLIETDGRRGTRVREASVGPRRYRRALDSQAGYRVDLSTGLPDPRLLPDLHAAMQRVPRDETAALLPRGARRAGPARRCSRSRGRTRSRH